MCIRDRFRPNDQLDQPRLVQCPQQRNMSKQVHRAQRHYVQFFATYFRCSRFSKSFWSSGQMINWINNDWYNVLSNGTCPNRFIELRDIIYNSCHVFEMFKILQIVLEFRSNDQLDQPRLVQCPQQQNMSKQFIELRDIIYNSLPRT